MNTLFPIICSLVIFLFPFAGKFRYSRQALNSIVISLGLLGTFSGITYCLLHFDPENITSSLPLLLTGLKTSILTIISGVVTSLLLKLIPGFYGIRREKETTPENLPNTLKEMLSQLIAIKDNIHKAGVVTNPDGSVQTTELFQDKALYDLARNTSQIMQKQSQYLSITQEENRRLYDQLQTLLTATQETNKNLESLIEKDVMRSNRKITAQVDELSQLVKNTSDQVTVQIKQMNEKRAKEIKELMQFAQTMQSIIKKLNQSHNALYKGLEEKTPEPSNSSNL